MITDFMITILTGSVQLILGVLPDVADTPSAIVDGGDWIIDQITSVISVLSMVLTPALLTATIVVAVGMLLFDNIYHGVMWVLRKIPILNIK